METYVSLGRLSERQVVDFQWNRRRCEEIYVKCLIRYTALADLYEEETISAFSDAGRN